MKDKILKNAKIPIGVPPRLAALNAVLQWKEGKGFVQENLQNTCEGLPENDRTLAYQIALGLTRSFIDINEKLKKITRKKPQEPHKTILEISLYQLFYMRIPQYAVINSACELARFVKIGEQSVKFVNAVLRNAIKTFGSENGGDLLAQQPEVPSQWIRINSQKTTVKEVARELGLEDKLLSGELKILFDRFIEISSAGDALRNPLFAQGYYSFQDPASFYIAKFISAFAGTNSSEKIKDKIKVWDCCAAPGGKTAMLAEDNPNAFFIASDVSEKRAEKLFDLQIRLDLKNVQICVTNAADPPFDCEFDCILADVPCSNLGVTSRRPEAKLRVNARNNELPQKQFAILQSVSACLKVGGILIYSTCSQEKAETTEVIEKFLSENSGWIQEDFIFTDLPNVDKFFVAKLRRIR